MGHQTINVHLCISRAGIDFRGVAGARPPGLRHYHWDTLMACHRHCANHRIHHHIEQVPVSDSGGEIVTVIKGVLLEESEPNGDLGVQAVHIVRVQIDQERRVGVVQELKQWFYQ